MIEKEQPDVLHVCTPHYLHVPMTQYALERGINVFMEKPPAIDLYFKFRYNPTCSSPTRPDLYDSR